jgi:hypothetical protein
MPVELVHPMLPATPAVGARSCKRRTRQLCGSARPEIRRLAGYHIELELLGPAAGPT